MKKEMKKGEMTSKTLISIILLILGFGIILFLYSQIFWEGTIDREVCHQSVIYRASLPNTAGIKDYVDLKCATYKYCLTAGGAGSNDCIKEYKNAEGVVSVDVESVRDIEKFMAREVYDCWAMMGEGRVSLFSQWLAEEYGLGLVYPTCFVCSRISIDQDIRNGEIDISKMDLFNYMKQYAPPGQNKSYYELISGESPANLGNINDVKFLPDVVDDKGKLLDPSNKKNVVYETANKETSQSYDELAVVFMQISSPGHWEAFANTIGAGAGIASAGAYVAGPRAVMNVAKLGTSKVGLALLAIGAIAQQGSVFYNRAVTAGYCGDVKIGNDARSGCSVVRTVKYDQEGISQYCQWFEGIG